MEIKKYIYILLLPCFLICKEENLYKINYLGMHVADCTIEYSDTTLFFLYRTPSDDHLPSMLVDTEVIEAVNIRVDVSTIGIIDKLFQVDNDYQLIINKKNGNLLYYKKNSYQPNVINYIETHPLTYNDYLNDKILYKSNNEKLSESYNTIFSVFYLLTHNKENILIDKDFIIEREAKLYTGNIQNQIKNQFDISIKENDSSQKGVVEHTDIFSWAIFREGGKKTIYLNEESDRIEKCIFNKGFISLAAEYQGK